MNLLHCLIFSAPREEQDGQKLEEHTVKAEQMTQVHSCLQKNSSKDKAVNHEERNEELSEVFTLRDQLKQAEERASQVQREV